MSLCSHGIELTVSLHSIPGLIAWMTKFKLKRPAKRSGELGYPALVFLLLLSKELILLHFKSVCQNPKYCYNILNKIIIILKK